MARPPAYYRDKAAQIREMADWRSLSRSDSNSIRWLADVWDELAEAAEKRDAFRKALRDQNP